MCSKRRYVPRREQSFQGRLDRAYEDKLIKDAVKYGLYDPYAKKEKKKEEDKEGWFMGSVRFVVEMIEAMSK